MSVPKLRFLEFQDALEWEEKRLGDIAVFFKGKGLPKSAITPSGKNLCVHYGELFTIYSEVIRTVKSRTDLSDGCFLSIENDVLMPTSDVTPNGLAKASCIKLNNVIIGGDALVIRTNRSEISGEFLSRNIRHLEKKVLQLISGSTVFHLYASSIKKLLLLFPSLLEQQKIADCLTSLESVITAQSQKLEALGVHKRGLMQQLFPSEGETVPKLRFLEFQDAGDWEESVLGSKVEKVGSGITPTGGDKNYKKSGRPFVRSQNVGWGELILDDIAFIDDATHSKFRATEIKNDDVLLNITGASIGRSAIADSRISGGNVNQHVCVIRTNTRELAPKFLNQYLLSQYGQKQIDSFQAGGNRQGLNFAQVRSFSIPITSILEQQKIADCLTTLEQLITAQKQKLELLRSHKKGLMQQLFPAPDETQT